MMCENCCNDSHQTGMWMCMYSMCSSQEGTVYLCASVSSYVHFMIGLHMSRDKNDRCVYVCVFFVDTCTNTSSTHTMLCDPCHVSVLTETTGSVLMQ